MKNIKNKEKQKKNIQSKKKMTFSRKIVGTFSVGSKIVEEKSRKMS